MGDASWADAARFVDVLLLGLWIALAIAIAVFLVAGMSKVLGPVGRWIEVRILPVVTRGARARHGLAPDAGPWACAACGSVNIPTAAACYHCGARRSDDDPELAEAAADPAIFHRPPPVSRFDPSRYRGPGALPAPADAEVGELPPRDARRP